jgi:uncharacterized protein (DUF433 family)
MSWEGIHLSDPSTVDRSNEESGEMIVSTPGTCGGKPRIAGHRIRVQDVVIWKEHMGMTIDEILSSYPTMTPEKIAVALQYYQTHREEIERGLKEDEEFADQIEADMKTVLIRVSE